MAQATHTQLNENHAIQINTKEPLFIHQTYKKTIFKQFEQSKVQHAEQLMQISTKLMRNLNKISEKCDSRQVGQ